MSPKEKREREWELSLKRAEQLGAAQELLESEGYLVARPPFHPFPESPGSWTSGGDDWVAFRVSRGDRSDYRTQPVKFCKGIGISQKTFIKKVKQSDCPEFEKRRGPKGRLVWLIPNQELITFLTRNKTG